MRRKKCPCCGFYTFIRPAHNGDICPVCFWEYDKVQNKDEDYEGGANEISLRTARSNFLFLGAIKESCRDKVRKPLPEEIKNEKNM